MSNDELVHVWAEVAIGTAVKVVKDDGSILHTRTRSSPWLLGESLHSKGHTPVIMVQGISGCYHLRRVTLVDK